jgi:hypothetical protein
MVLPTETFGEDVEGNVRAVLSKKLGGMPGTNEPREGLGMNLVCLLSSCLPRDRY